MRFNLFILLFESKIPSENVFLFTLWSFTFKILFDKILCVAYDLSLWIKFVQSPCRCEKQLKPIFILNHQVMTPLLLDVGCRWVCVEAHKNQFLQESKKRAYAILLFNVLCACAYECLCVCVVCLAFGIQFIHDNEITEKCIHPIHLTRWFFTVVDILQCTWHTHTRTQKMIRTGASKEGKKWWDWKSEGKKATNQIYNANFISSLLILHWKEEILKKKRWKQFMTWKIKFIHMYMELIGCARMWASEEEDNFVTGSCVGCM